PPIPSFSPPCVPVFPYETDGSRRRRREAEESRGFLSAFLRETPLGEVSGALLFGAPLVGAETGGGGAIPGLLVDASPATSRKVLHNFEVLVHYRATASPARVKFSKFC
ncbi:unnamed protein product, partial [Urochloa humidicola]